MKHKRQDRSGGFDRRALAALLGLALAASTGPTFSESWTVTADPCLNLREIPDQSSEALRCLANGSELEVLESVTGWKRVSADDGIAGWVSDRFLSPPAADVGASTGSSTEGGEQAMAADRIRRLQAELQIASEELESFRALAGATEAELRAQISALQGREATADANRIAELERSLDEARREAADARQEPTAESAIDPEEHALLQRELTAERTRTAELTEENARLAQQAAEAGERLTELQMRITALESAGLEQGRRIDELTAGEKQFDERLAERESRIAELAAAAKAQQNRADEIEARSGIVELERRLEEQEAEMLSVETENDSLRRRVAELEGSSGAVANTDGQEPLGDGASASPGGDRIAESELPAAKQAATSSIDQARAAAESVPIEGGPTAADSLPETVALWAQAWSAQSVDRYLAFYAPEFEPRGGLSRQAWEAQRRERLAAPKFIEVTISDFALESVEGDRAKVRFAQSYRSDSYSDNVTKVLDLVRADDGAWRIARERSQ